MKEKQTRKEKVVRAFNSAGFEFKGVKYKPLSLRTLSLLQDVKSPYITGGDQIKGLMDFMYVSATSNEDVLQVIANDNWKITVLDFAEQFSLDDLEEIGKLVANQSDTASAAIVEVREDAQKK